MITREWCLLFALVAAVAQPASLELEDIRRRAESGDGRAQLELADRLAKGVAGAEPSDADSAVWYMKAANHDTPEGRAAKLRLAALYEEGKGVPQSSLRALELYEELDGHESTADQVCKIHLAVLFEDVRGLTWSIRTDRHREWFVRTFKRTQASLAAASNLPTGSSVEMQKRAMMLKIQAHFTLGWLHKRGFGTAAPDAAKSVEAYQTAMALSDVRLGPGHASGALLVNLGRLYEEGRGVAAAPHMAAALYQQATEGQVLGDGLGAIGQSERLHGALHLARMHELGHGVGRSDPEASWLYRDAARMGHAAALYHTGRLYEAGRMYTERDASVPLLSNAIAARSYARAARLGHVPAMVSLARMYEGGLGVPRSEPKAAYWYVQAAALRYDARDPLVVLARAGDEARAGEEPSLRGGSSAGGGAGSGGAGGGGAGGGGSGGDGDGGSNRPAAAGGADGRREPSSGRAAADADSTPPLRGPIDGVSTSAGAMGASAGVLSAVGAASLPSARSARDGAREERGERAPAVGSAAIDGLRALQLLQIVTLCAAALLWAAVDVVPTADPPPRAHVPPARADPPIPAGASSRRGMLFLGLAPLALLHVAALFTAWSGSLLMSVSAAGTAATAAVVQAVYVARRRRLVAPTPRAARTAQRRARRAATARVVDWWWRILVLAGSLDAPTVKMALSALLAALALALSATDAYLSHHRPSVSSAVGTSTADVAAGAGVTVGAAGSVCESYPDTRRANMLVLLLACSVGALAFSVACVWLHLQRSRVTSSLAAFGSTAEAVDVDEFAEALSSADAPAAVTHDVEQSDQRRRAAVAASQRAAQQRATTEYYAWRHRLMLGPHVVLMLLTMLIWLLLPWLHACFGVLTQAAMGNILISLSSRLMTAAMEDPVRGAQLDTYIRNGKIIATGCLILWLNLQRQIQIMAVDPTSDETADNIKARLLLMMIKLALPTIGEDSEPEVLMEEFFDCPRIKYSWSISAFQNSHSLLRVPVQATQGAIAGIGGFAGAAHPLSRPAVVAMLMWNVGPWVQCSLFLDQHALWNGPCVPIATLELASTFAAFVVMFVWARLTLGVVEHELHARHRHAATRRAAADPSSSASKPPEFLVCPITLEVMDDPVATADGQVYERTAIQAWLAEHDASPLTGVRLEHRRLISIPVIRSACLEFLAKRMDSRKV